MNEYIFANGRQAVDPNKSYRVEAIAPLANADWKTAITHQQRSIDIGEQGTMLKITANLYGVWAYVKFDHVDFNVYTYFSNLDCLGESECTSAT